MKDRTDDKLDVPSLTRAEIVAGLTGEAYSRLRSAAFDARRACEDIASYDKNAFAAIAEARAALVKAERYATALVELQP